MWFISTTLAFAGTPVVHDGGVPTEVIATVSSRTGLPTTQLDSIPLDTLLGAPPQALGGAVVRRCTKGPTQNAAVESEVVRAEAALVVNTDVVGAMDHLDLAVAELGCLGELVDTETAARVFLMRGALGAETEEETARGEMRTALAFDREVAWHDKLPEAGKKLLEEERANPATHRLDVAPASSSSGPWLDGRAVVVGSLGTTVQQGLHLVQYGTSTGIRSAWLVLGGDASLVIPGSFRRPVVERFADKEAWPEVQALVAAAIPDFFAAYVYHGGGLWLVSKDEGMVSTTEIAAPPPPPPPPEEGKGKKAKKDKKKAKRNQGR
jgi:hypothetical protein